jgi:hypothetical protein
MIPVWAVPGIFRNTEKGIRGISIFLFISDFHYFPFLFCRTNCPTGQADCAHDNKRQQT